LQPHVPAFTPFEDLTERLSFLTQTALYRACSAHGLTPTQYSALAAINALGEPKMSRLAAHLGLSPGACTTLMDRLVRQGWVERRSDPADRRSVCIHASAQGAEAFEAVNRARRQMTQEVYQGIDPATREQLRQSVETLVEGMQQYLRSHDDR